MARSRLLSCAKKCERPFAALGMFVLVWLCSGPCAAAGNPDNVFEYCYTNFPDATGYAQNQPTYFTAVFAVQGQSVYGEEFAQYVQKKYSLHYPGPAGCSYSGIKSGVEASLHQRVAQVRAAGHTVVETNWTKDNHAALMAELKANPPPPPPPPASTAPKAPPPPSAAQTVYEKAMAAQRPASNTAAPQNAAGAPVSGPVQKYTYCVSLGSPRGNGSGHTIYYYTAVFLVSPTNNPQQAFRLMLEAAHPQEYISNVSCMTAQPMDQMQIALANDVRGKREKHDVVETNWKPKM